jgi:alcohol dehydrogenase
LENIQFRDFSFYTPTKIIFGRNCLAKNLRSVVNSYGIKPLMITGRYAMNNNGIDEKVMSFLGHDHQPLNIFRGVSPNPKSDEVNKGVEYGIKENVDCLIALGGGSVLDAAKVIAHCIYNKIGNCETLIGKTLSEEAKSLPLIAIPTTAGSGSEVTMGAIITDVRKKIKSGIRGNCIFPKVAIVDPQLSSTMPVHVAVETGFDVLSHAIETFFARKSNPISDIISREIISRITVPLRRIAAGRKTNDDEDVMSFLSLLGGINVGNCGTCLPHRLQQATGAIGRVEVAHARAIASLYRGWLPKVVPYVAERSKLVSRLMGGDGNLVKDIQSLLSDLDMADSLSSYGYREKHITEIIENITGNVENDPIDNIDTNLFSDILLSSL